MLLLRFIITKKNIYLHIKIYFLKFVPGLTQKQIPQEILLIIVELKLCCVFPQTMIVATFKSVAIPQKFVVGFFSFPCVGGADDDIF